MSETYRNALRYAERQIAALTKENKALERQLAIEKGRHSEAERNLVALAESSSAEIKRLSDDLHDREADVYELKAANKQLKDALSALKGKVEIILNASDRCMAARQDASTIAALTKKVEELEKERDMWEKSFKDLMVEPCNCHLKLAAVTERVERLESLWLEKDEDNEVVGEVILKKEVLAIIDKELRK